MSLRKWHRRSGVVALLVMLIISITGLMLMVIPGSALGQREINSGIINKLYGKTPDYGPAGLTLPNVQLVQMDNTLFLGDIAAIGFTGKMNGAVNIDEGVVVSTEENLYLYQLSGQLLDQVGSALLPDKVMRLGLMADIVVIETRAGIFTGDETLSFWTMLGDADVNWSVVEQLSESGRREALRRYSGSGVPFGRLMLDLHTGRLFGVVGQTVVWIGTLIMIFLAISGGVMWAKRFSRMRSKR